MHRRDFLKSGSGAAVVGTAAFSETIVRAAAAAESETAATGTPAILASYNSEDHRRRLENIRHCHRSIGACLRKHLITDYLPGQCTYNLGEYPCRKPWDPDEWDEAELDRLRDHGIRLIHLHEDWCDSQRLYGSHKLAPLNPAGFRRFVETLNMKF